MRNLRVAKEKISMEKIKNSFFVFDVETTKLEPMPENFVFGVIYGNDFSRTFYSVDAFKKEFENPKYKNKYVFAHNAEFDLLTLFGNIFTEIDNTAIFNGKFISAKYNDITFADSMNIYPTSVEKIGNLIGLQKIENQKVKTEKLKKDNISVEDVVYCKRDCEIVFNALLRIFELTGTIKITLPSLAMFDFRYNYLPDDIFFSELVDEFYESYYGGRCEAFKIGNIKGGANVYDINSLYPFAMRNCVFPDIKHLKKTVHTDVKFLLFCIKYYEGMTKVKIRHKETFIGYIPVRLELNKSNKLAFPVGEFITTINFNELRFAMEAGIIEILEVFYIIYGNPIESPFVKFVDDNYRLRNENKDELNRTIYKLKLNALYGRFAMQMKMTTTYYDEIPFKLINELKETEKYCDLKLFNQERADCFLITENEKFKNSFFSIPTFSSYITSEARVILLKNLLANDKNNIVYCDTDSIFIIGNFIGNVSDRLGDFKQEERNITYVEGLKNYRYINEKGEEVEVIKGISKNAVKTKDGYLVKKYFKTKEALRRNKDAGRQYEVLKVLKHKYDKRIVLQDGNTKPIKI